MEFSFQIFLGYRYWINCLSFFNTLLSENVLYYTRIHTVEHSDSDSKLSDSTNQQCTLFLLKFFFFSCGFCATFLCELEERGVMRFISVYSWYSMKISDKCQTSGEQNGVGEWEIAFLVSNKNRFSGRKNLDIPNENLQWVQNQIISKSWFVLVFLLIFSLICEKLLLMLSIARIHYKINITYYIDEFAIG